MRSWRNWQTRKTKDLVGNTMQVQFLSTAPKIGKDEIVFPDFFDAGPTVPRAFPSTRPVPCHAESRPSDPGTNPIATQKYKGAAA